MNLDRPLVHSRRPSRIMAVKTYRNTKTSDDLGSYSPSMNCTSNHSMFFGTDVLAAHLIGGNFQRMSCQYAFVLHILFTYTASTIRWPSCVGVAVLSCCKESNQVPQANEPPI